MDLMGYSDKQLIFGTLLALSNRIQCMGDRFYKEITLKQLFLILVLQLFEGCAPTLKELADAAGSSYQNVKQMVLKLEKQKIVEIAGDEHDKRKMRIYITDSCDKLLGGYQDKAQQFLDKLFQETAPGDLETTLATLKKMEKNLLED